VDVEEDIVGKSLLEILRDVAVDPAQQAVLEQMGAAPYLARHGFHDVDPEDVREAVGLVADTLPPDVAQALAFARSHPVQGPGEPGEADIAAFGDVTEQLDGMARHHAGDHYGTGAPGDNALDAPHDTMDAGADQQASLTFGSGADAGAGAGAAAGPPGHDGAIGSGVDALGGSGHGVPPGDAMAAPGSGDLTQDPDAGAGLEDVDAWTGEVDGIGSFQLPDDPAALDDIGSF
jgi:hypothetical protein